MSRRVRASGDRATGGAVVGSLPLASPEGVNQNGFLLTTFQGLTKIPGCPGPDSHGWTRLGGDPPG